MDAGLKVLIVSQNQSEVAAIFFRYGALLKGELIDMRERGLWSLARLRFRLVLAAYCGVVAYRGALSCDELGIIVLVMKGEDLGPRETALLATIIVLHLGSRGLDRMSHTLCVLLLLFLAFACLAFNSILKHAEVEIEMRVGGTVLSQILLIN
jgi:hypothetical protein